MEETSLKDTIPLEEVQLESDLTYEEKPIKILDTAERVTRTKTIKFGKSSGTIIPKKKQHGKDKKIFGKTTLTYFLTNPNLEGEIHLKGVRFVTSLKS